MDSKLNSISGSVLSEQTSAQNGQKIIVDTSPDDNHTSPMEYLQKLFPETSEKPADSFQNQSAYPKELETMPEFDRLSDEKHESSSQEAVYEVHTPREASNQHETSYHLRTKRRLNYLDINEPEKKAKTSPKKPKKSTPAQDADEPAPKKPRGRPAKPRFDEKLDCSFCGKTFTSKKGLSYHENMHTGNRPYVCDFCGLSFPNPDNMVKHRRMHTGEKPYGCRYCDAKFARSDTRRDHEYTHSGERPYACKECGKTYTQLSAVLTHQKRDHKKANGIETIDAASLGVIIE